MATKKVIDTVKKFIEENGLEFNYESGSDINSNCTILSGFALYNGIKNVKDLFPIVNKIAHDELERVFSYAHSNGYGSWWAVHTEEAKKFYKF